MMKLALAMISAGVIFVGTQPECAPQDVAPCSYDSRDLPSNEFFPSKGILEGAKSIRVSVWRSTTEGDKKDRELANILSHELTSVAPSMTIATEEAADLRVCVILTANEQADDVRALVWIVDCRGECTPADAEAVRFCTADFTEELLMKNLAYRLKQVFERGRTSPPPAG